MNILGGERGCPGGEWWIVVSVRQMPKTFQMGVNHTTNSNANLGLQCFKLCPSTNGLVPFGVLPLDLRHESLAVGRTFPRQKRSYLSQCQECGGVQSHPANLEPCGILSSYVDRISSHWSPFTRQAFHFNLMEQLQVPLRRSSLQMNQKKSSICVEFPQYLIADSRSERSVPRGT